MNKTKKLSTILVSLAAVFMLVLGVTFGGVGVAYAAETGTDAPVGDNNFCQLLLVEKTPDGEDMSVNFRSIKKAIEALEADTEGKYQHIITLMKDHTESIEIPAELTVTLNLGGNVLTNEAGKHTITNNGTLTIVAESNGTVDNVSHQRGAIVNNGTVTLNGGKYTRSQEAGVDVWIDGKNIKDAHGNSYYVIQNEGVMTINNAVVTYNNNEVTVENKGTFSSLIANNAKTYKEGNKSNLTINGGTFNGGKITVKNDEAGELLITGGTFTANLDQSVQNWAKATITGGTFNNKVITWEYAGNIGWGDEKNNSLTTITGGTFNEEVGTRLDGATDRKPQPAISGGTFSVLPKEEFLAKGYAFVENAGKYEALTYKAAAENYHIVAVVGGLGYTSFTEAVAAATDGETVALIQDVAISEPVRIYEDITLDLGTSKIYLKEDFTPENQGAIIIEYYANVEIIGSTETEEDGTIKQGTIDASGTENSGIGNVYGAIMLTEKGKPDGITPNDGTNYNYPCTLTVEGVKIIGGEYYGVVGQGTRHGTNVTLKNCNIKAPATAIYHPQDGILKVEDCTIEGVNTGIEMRSGTLTVDGDTKITATAKEYSAKSNGSGTTIIGAAIAISQHSTNKAINVTVNSGTFTGAMALAQADVPGKTEPIKIAITGGDFKGGITTTREGLEGFIDSETATFTDLPDMKYFAPNCVAEEHTDDQGNTYYGAVKGNYVVSITDENGKTNGYTSLANAVKAAAAGSTIQLIADYELKENVIVEKNITLDLNGKKLTITTENAGLYASANGYYTNPISATNKVPTGYVDCTKEAILTITTSVEGGKILAPNGYAITAQYGGTVVVESGTIDAKYSALSSNNQGGKGNFTVNGGTLTTEKGPAIYMPADGTLTVEGGTLNGGAIVRMGTVNISGGEFIAPTANIDTINEYYAYSGNAWLGGALTFLTGAYKFNGETATLNASITGGKFVNKYNGTDYTYANNAITTFVTGNVEQNISVKVADTGVEYDVTNGKNFVTYNVAGIVGEGYKYNKVANVPTINDVKQAATNGLEFFATLQEAVEAVPANGIQTTITLLGNAKGDGIIIGDSNGINNKNIIFDLNGFEYEINGETVGSVGTQTLAFQLLKGSTVKFMNGSINVTSPNARMIMQNYCDLTLENVTLTSNNNGIYFISNNNGKLTATGDTQILADASKNQVAFDVYYWPSYYPARIEVNFDKNFTGKVTGIVEYGTETTSEAEPNWQENATLNIEEGATGTFDVIFETYQNDGATGTPDGRENANINIAGGTFTELPDHNFFVDGYVAKLDKETGLYVTQEGTWVAYVGTKGYTSLQDAIGAITTEGTVELIVDATESIVIPEDKNVILNIAEGITLTNNGEHTIINNGTLTITGNGTIDNITHGKAAVVNNGTAYIYGGKYIRSAEKGASGTESGGNSYYVLLNYGTMTIGENAESKVEVISTGHFSSLVENGWFNGYENTEKTNSVLTIKGGYFSGGINTIKNDDYGVMIIENGTFENVSQYVVLNWNELTIKNGKFSINEGATAAVSTGHTDKGFNAGTTTITGGEFNGGLTFYKGSEAGVTYNVSGGTYTISAISELNLSKLTLEAEYVVYVKEIATYAVRAASGLEATIAKIEDVSDEDKANGKLVAGRSASSFKTQRFEFYKNYNETKIDGMYVVIGCEQFAALKVEELKAYHAELNATYEYSEGGKLDLAELLDAGVAAIEEHGKNEEYAKIESTFNTYKKAMDEVLTKLSYEKKLNEIRDEYMIDIKAHAAINGVSMTEEAVNTAVEALKAVVQISKLVGAKQAAMEAINTVKGQLDAAEAFNNKKADAIAEVQAYAAANKVVLADSFITAIREANTEAELSKAVADAKAEVDNQVTARELAQAKLDAIEFAQLYAAALDVEFLPAYAAEINGATTLAGVAEAKDNVIKAINAVKDAPETLEEMIAKALEEVQAYAAANKVVLDEEEHIKPISKATTKEALDAAVTAAKAAIDTLAESLKGSAIDKIFTAGGDLDGNTVVYDKTMLYEATNPQNIKTYWVGIQVKAPAYITAGTVTNAKYYINGEEKSFDTYRDGEYFIQLWAGVTKEHIQKALALDTNLEYTWEFDWNGDKVIDFTATIRVMAKTVVLFGDYKAEAIAEIKDYAAERNVAVAGFMADINAATTKEALDAAVEATKKAIDVAILAEAKSEALEYVKLYAAAMHVEYKTDYTNKINNAETPADVAAAKAEIIAAIDEAYMAMESANKELSDAKKAAIAAIKEAAAATGDSEAVVVPTATYAAINAAVDLDQVEEFKANAIAEIADIRAFRAQINDLGTNGTNILKAIAEFRKALLGGEGADGKLAEMENALKEYLDGIKEDINECTSTELLEAKEELNEAITAAKDALEEKIDELSESLLDQVDGILEALTKMEENFDTRIDNDIVFELGVIKDDLATLSDDLYSNYSDLYDMLVDAQTSIDEANSTLETLTETVEGIVDEILNSDEFTALATKDDVTAVSEAVATLSDALLNGETGAIVNLKTALENAIKGVETKVDGIVTSLANLASKEDVAAVKAAVEAIQPTDLTDINKNITDLKTALETAIKGVSDKVDGIVTSIATLATKEDVAAVKAAVEAIKPTDLTEVNSKIDALKTELTNAIAGVKTTVDGIVGSIATLASKEDVAAVKAAVEAIQPTDLTDINKNITDLKTALETAIKGVSDKVDGIVTSIATLATKEDVAAVKAAVEAIKPTDLTEVNSKIDTLKTELTNAIAGVKTTVDGIVTSIATLASKQDVDDIKAAIKEIKPTDLTGVNTKIDTLKTALEKAIKDAADALDGKINTLTTNLATLTGRLEEVNSGLVEDIEELSKKVAELALDSDIDALATKLEGMTTTIGAIAEKVQAGVDVEEEKNVAIDSIKQVLSSLLGEEQQGKMATAAPTATESAEGLTAEQRNKLTELYGEKLAALIEQYYNDAMEDVKNATTISEAQAAVNNFKSNVATAKMVSTIDTGVSSGVYVMLAFAIIFSAAAFVLVLVLFLKKRNNNEAASENEATSDKE